MKLAKEPKQIDFLIKSEGWTDADLADFRKRMQDIKNKARKDTASKQVRWNKAETKSVAG